MDLIRNEDRGSIVSRDDIEGLLANVARGAVDANVGIFGPDSMSWKINRESALFLGAGRAALMQLAHPWVATALVEHSSLMAKPIARFHNTFRVVFTMIFGSLNQAMAAARHLHALHTRIRGEIPEDVAAYQRGSPYEANEIAALRWVYATLVESAVIAYECVMPRLKAEEVAAYYAESKTLAALFGLPSSALPDDWNAFLSYCRQMEQSNTLGVNEKSRSMAHNLLAGSVSWIHPPHWYRALTTEWMPLRFREEFALGFGAAEQRAAETAKRRLPQIYRKLPATVRFVGPWHEATARLKRRDASVLTRASNRFWIGQSRLPFRNNLESGSQS
jgi:uncharacterized protein (DUF2236 family)